MIDQSGPAGIRGNNIEQYTPASGRIKSANLKNSSGAALILARARFMVTSNANITFKDYTGGPSVVLAVLAGVEYQFAVSEISALSAGNVFILHDGEPYANQQV
jgi:hypothetical protein